VRESIITPGGQDETTPTAGWLALDRRARVEVTSEDPDHPVEAALIPDRGPGWWAAGPGSQIVRLRFDEPQLIRRIWLHFAEPAVVRTQELLLRWGTTDDQPTREIVRQQWVDVQPRRLDLRDRGLPGRSLGGVGIRTCDLPGHFRLRRPRVAGGDARRVGPRPPGSEEMTCTAC
jgi:hypothetical protein